MDRGHTRLVRAFRAGMAGSRACPGSGSFASAQKGIGRRHEVGHVRAYSVVSRRLQFYRTSDEYKSEQFESFTNGIFIFIIMSADIRLCTRKFWYIAVPKTISAMQEERLLQRGVGGRMRRIGRRGHAERDGVTPGLASLRFMAPAVLRRSAQCIANGFVREHAEQASAFQGSQKQGRQVASPIRKSGSTHMRRINRGRPNQSSHNQKSCREGYHG